MKYKVVFTDLGWYEVEAKSRTEAEALGVSAGYLVDRMPPRRVDVCPCCGAKLEPQKGGVRYELPRVSGEEN